MKTLFLLLLAGLIWSPQFPRHTQTLSLYRFPDFLNAPPVELSLDGTTVTAKNIAGRAIKYIEAEVEFPSTSHANLRLIAGSRHVLAPSIHGEDDAPSLQPDESVLLRPRAEFPRFRLGVVRPIIVLFDDGSGWEIGYPVHRDSVNSARWLVDESFYAELSSRLFRRAPASVPAPKFIRAGLGREDPGSGNCYRFEGSTTVACNPFGCSANAFTVRQAQDGFKLKSRTFQCSGEGSCGNYSGTDTDNGSPCLGPDIE